MEKYEAADAPPPHGLVNVGNTCYFNSLVQALLSCPQFGRVIRKYSTPLCSQYRRILERSLVNDSEVIDPSALLHTLIGVRAAKGLSNLRSSNQEDTHEAYTFLIDSIKEELGGSSQDVHKLFDIRQRNFNKCFECERIDLCKIRELQKILSKLSAGESASNIFATCDIKTLRARSHYINIPEHISDVVEYIKQRPEELEPVMAGILAGTEPEKLLPRYIVEVVKQPSHAINIPEGVADEIEYIKSHEIDLVGYRCEKCGSVDTTKQRVCLANIPEIFVLVFMKYKKKFPVTAPEIFKMETVRDVSLFKLVAKVQHFGGEMGGHYSMQTHRPSGKFECDDSRVTSIGNMLPDENTYMLFYAYIDSQPKPQLKK